MNVWVLKIKQVILKFKTKMNQYHSNVYKNYYTIVLFQAIAVGTTYLFVLVQFHTEGE